MEINLKKVQKIFPIALCFNPRFSILLLAFQTFFSPFFVVFRSVIVTIFLVSFLFFFNVNNVNENK